MINVKDHQTGLLFDPIDDFSPKRRKRLKASWAYEFRREILPVLPVEELAKEYDPLMGAPTKELGSMMGFVLLQQVFDYTDEEATDQLAFNTQWHYALNIGQISDQTAYVCDRTLWGLRDTMSRKGLHDEMFQRITQKLAKVHHVDTSLQRLDSVLMFSNMRHLGRIRLFVCTLQKFLRSLKRHFPGDAGWGRVDKTLIERYQEKHPGSCFAMVKPSESSRTLQQMADDLLTLVQCFRKDAAVCQKASYKLLLRVLAEQCVVAEAEEAAAKVALKPSKDISADSLQNPSDPEAGYDAHKGQGYQAQVCETYSRDPDKAALSLITYVATESAANSDANALEAVIDDLQSRDRGPTELLCDALYGGDGNQQKAAEKGVEVVAPMMGRKPGTDKAVGLADFKVGKKSATCPRGFSSEKVKQNKHSTTLIFNSEVCRKCPLLSGCPVQQATVGFYVRVDAKALRVAQRRAYEKTPAFREVYRFRAGVEAAMSQFDRRTGVKYCWHCRVRGLRAMSFCVALKAAGINILRAVAFKLRQKQPDLAPHPRFLSISRLLSLLYGRFHPLKSPILEIGSNITLFFYPTAHSEDSGYKLAA